MRSLIDSGAGEHRWTYLKGDLHFPAWLVSSGNCVSRIMGHLDETFSEPTCPSISRSDENTSSFPSATDRKEQRLTSESVPSGAGIDAVRLCRKIRCRCGAEVAKGVAMNDDLRGPER